jgi:ubiquinone biosynthesis protein UbiJ
MRPSPRQRARAPSRIARGIVLPRIEWTALKHDLAACADQVGRLEKKIEFLETELHRLREKIRS